ncbi:hypothetical protein A2U01_0043845 [Trifolium medium]|uniref:Uncharacterized protein n=1 Tax=Trifolium medium TaxID=97028 RepID=A0A392QFH8_9FABA|nr:hypothetical protein [Trifolium medium]
MKPNRTAILLYSPQFQSNGFCVIRHHHGADSTLQNTPPSFLRRTSSFAPPSPQPQIRCYFIQQPLSHSVFHFIHFCAVIALAP